MSDQIRTVIATVKKLAQMDPGDAAVEATVDGLAGQAAALGEQPREASAPASDMSLVRGQIAKLQAAASAPLRNYRRISAILDGLARAAAAAEQPRYADRRQRIATIAQKVAGLFAEVDTVQDLDKPLEQIEKAVHGLYGDQSKNSTFYLGRRGKGHHGE